MKTLQPNCSSKTSTLLTAAFEFSACQITCNKLSALLLLGSPWKPKRFLPLPTFRRRRRRKEKKGEKIHRDFECKEERTWSNSGRRRQEYSVHSSRREWRGGIPRQINPCSPLLFCFLFPSGHFLSLSPLSFFHPPSALLCNCPGGIIISSGGPGENSWQPFGPVGMQFAAP